MRKLLIIKAKRLSSEHTKIGEFAMPLVATIYFQKIIYRGFKMLMGTRPRGTTVMAFGLKAITEGRMPDIAEVRKTIPFIYPFIVHSKQFNFVMRNN